MLFHDSVTLPKTYAAWKTAGTDVHDVLETELNREAAGILDGYNSDEERVEVLDLKVDEDRLTARFAIHFDEVIPSGCADHPHRKECRIELRIHMDADSDLAMFDEDFTNDANANQWDLWDRNSAADGY